MDRLNTSLFKGNVFSSGGYSAMYGQALSSVLILESIDFPERNSVDIGISPIFVSAGFQNVNEEKTKSFGVSAAYTNLGLMTEIIRFNNDFTEAPTGFGTNFNFRVKNRAGGILKYYGSFDMNKLGLEAKSLEPQTDFENTSLKGANTFHNLSFRQKFGKYVFTAGSSYTFNRNQLFLSETYQNEDQNPNSIAVKGNYFNVKATIERRINKISAVRGGVEFNNSAETTAVALSPTPYKFNEDITSVFAETDLGFSNNLSAKIGLRTEHSAALDKWNMAPRAALAYRLAKNWTSSFAYGIFYQNPENQFFAKGIEFFWRDRKSLKNIDYWISYSYLDSEREFQNYDRPFFPSFAAKHTLSVVAKKFVTHWKTGFNLSYNYASGRPYYNFLTDAGGNYYLNALGTVKDNSTLNFSLNYLPNLGKKDAKSFSVLVLSVNNILGRKNIFGYNFSNDGLRSSPILPSANTFVFIGAFISFGVDRTQDAINNNL